MNTAPEACIPQAQTQQSKGGNSRKGKSNKQTQDQSQLQQVLEGGSMAQGQTIVFDPTNLEAQAVSAESLRVAHSVIDPNPMTNPDAFGDATKLQIRAAVKRPINSALFAFKWLAVAGFAYGALSVVVLNLNGVRTSTNLSESSPATFLPTLGSAGAQLVIDATTPTLQQGNAILVNHFQGATGGTVTPAVVPPTTASPSVPATTSDQNVVEINWTP